MRLAIAALSILAASTAVQSGAVLRWTPAGISSPRFESHAAFDPKTGDMYFVRSSPQFQGWRILMSRCTTAGWSAPEPPAFAGDGVEADPFFSRDGSSLFFISSRSTDGIKGRGLDMWRVDRDAAGAWKTPERLPEPLNSAGAEWFPRPGTDGWLYFGSDRPGGLGATDIWRARRNDAGQWVVANLGSAVNTAGDDYEAESSPDGKRLIVMADGGLYESRLLRDGWSPRVALGPEINQTGLVVGPLFSPSGRSLLFSRDTKGPASGEFFVWHERGDETWPPDCRPKG